MLLNSVFLVYLLINIRTTKQQQLPPGINVEGRVGTDITIATIEFLQQVFPDDNRLFRRIAYVESRDGTASDTFRANYFGGIWQVDEAVYDATQNQSHPSYNELVTNIENIIFLDWRLVIWRDLTIPIISGIAAHLFIAFSRADIPGVSNVREQAQLWKDSGYNRDANKTVQTFVNAVSEFELQGESHNHTLVIATY